MSTQQNIAIEEMNWADYCDALSTEHYQATLAKLKISTDLKKSAEGVLREQNFTQDAVKTN